MALLEQQDKRYGVGYPRCVGTRAESDTTPPVPRILFVLSTLTFCLQVCQMMGKGLRIIWFGGCKFGTHGASR